MINACSTALSLDSPSASRLSSRRASARFTLRVISSLPRSKRSHRLLASAFGLFALALSPCSAISSGDPSDLNGNQIPDAEEALVIIDHDVSLSAGEYSFNDLVISEGATLSAEGAPDLAGAFKGVKIRAASLTVSNGASISANASGYAPSSGQGYFGSCVGFSCPGSSYGGVGGSNVSTSTYGSAMRPVDLGSGGSFTARGGGAIWLEVSGDLVNEGRVSANGGSSASGGSIYVVAGRLSGSGAFEAKGGGWAYGAVSYLPGGGGRIAVHYATSTFAGVADASGGCWPGTSASCVESGTVGFFNTIENDLIAGERWRFEETDSPFDLRNIVIASGSEAEIAPGADISAASIMVDDTSTLAVTGTSTIEADSISLDRGSTLFLSGGESLAIRSLSVLGTSTLTTIPEKRLFLDIPNIVVSAGSSISVDGKGYSYLSGPGAPASENYWAGSSHGGVGYNNAATSTYGSEREPVDLGSGSHSGDRGGGIIRINASDSLLNDGIVSANGARTSSGGSIHVTAKNLSGSGAFRANGGDSYCPNGCFGPGGGGRIAIYYEGTAFTGVAEALGGMYCFGGCFRLGGSGTVVFEEACVSDCFSNVMFIPGLLASRLYQGSPLDGEVRLWEPSTIGSFLIPKLSMDGLGKSVHSDIYTKDVLDEALGVLNIYKSFIEDMDDLVADGAINDWEPVPYDWRLSVDEIIGGGTWDGERLWYLTPTSSPYMIQRLVQLALESKTGKATIVAHSNGGLITKALMIRLEELGLTDLVDKIILVASPQHGTPDAIGALLHGHELGIPLLASARSLREVARNMPGVYGLLPSREYFDLVSDPVVSFSTTSTFSLLEASVARFGSTIASHAPLVDFLLGIEGRPAPSFSDLVSANILNQILISQADALHDRIDSWTPPSNVELYQIAGWGMDTVKGIEYFEGVKKRKPVLQYRPLTTEDGDGTVVVPSALAMATSTINIKRIWLDIQTHNLEHSPDREHRDILEIKNLRDYIKSVLTNNFNFSDEYISEISPPPTNPSRRLGYLLISPVFAFDLYDDQGNHTGISTTTGLAEENIPGTVYREFGDVKYISIPTETIVSINQYSPPRHGRSSSVRIVISPPPPSMSTVSEESPVPLNLGVEESYTLIVEEREGEEVLDAVSFTDVIVPTESYSSLDVPSSISEMPELEVDVGNDGIIDQEIQPGEESVSVSQVVPPSEQVSIASQEERSVPLAPRTSGSRSRVPSIPRSEPILISLDVSAEASIETIETRSQPQNADLKAEAKDDREEERAVLVVQGQTASVHDAVSEDKLKKLALLIIDRIRGILGFLFNLFRNEK